MTAPAPTGGDVDEDIVTGKMVVGEDDVVSVVGLEVGDETVDETSVVWHHYDHALTTYVTTCGMCSFDEDPLSVLGDAGGA